MFFFYGDFSYNRISLLDCFDDTLCNCDGSLNLNKQQLIRMCIERETTKKEF